MKLFAIVLSILWCSMLSNAAPLPRIGDSIDVAERNYFELFPLAGDFKDAFVYGNDRGDSNYIVLTYGTPPRELLYFFDEIGYPQFGEYLNHFEEFALGHRKSDLTKIADIISGFQVHHPRGPKLSVLRTDGSTEAGRLYYIHSSGLILTHGDDPLNWQDASSYSVIQADEVSQIRNIGRNTLKNAGLGVLCGVVLGGSIGLLGGDVPYIRAEGVALIYGTALGLVGGLAGIVHSRFNPPKRFKIDGSLDRFARAESWLDEKASSQYLPPELQPATP